MENRYDRINIEYDVYVGSQKTDSRTLSLLNRSIREASSQFRNDTRNIKVDMLRYDIPSRKTNSR